MYTSFIGLYVRPGQAGRVEKALEPMAEVVEIYEMSGPFDLLAKASSATRQCIESLAGDILALEGVEKTFNMLSIGEKCVNNADTPMAAFLGLSVEAGKERDVEAALLSGGSIMETYATIYPYGLLVKVGYESERDLAAISDRALHIEGVRSCDEFIITRLLKH